MILMCGDIHGEWRKLVFNLTERYKIKNASVFILGDIGMGFDNSYKYDFQRISKKLEKNDITLYSIRGNHDDPRYFNGDLKVNTYPRIKFLKDYEVIEVEGVRILPIGGAISIDKDWRLEEERSSKKKIYWEDEDIIRESKFDINVDVVISHESPLSFDPILIRDKDLNENLYKSILNSRKYLDTVLLNISDNCKRWYFGHYHRSISGNYGKIVYHGLDIQEIQELVM